MCGTWHIIKTLFFIFLKKLHEKEANSISPFGSLENMRENIAKAKQKILRYYVFPTLSLLPKRK
jgi:hypothetical protein